MCRGNGRARVTFKTASDAKLAIEKYNNVALDDKPMKIELERVR